MKLRVINIVFSAILLATIARAGQPVRVVLLAGQSNMAGRGVYAELDDVIKARVDEASQRVRVSVDGHSAQPLSFSKANQHTKAFGPELFVGLTLAERNPGREYLLIKTSMGGTSLYGAWSPDWTEEKAKAVENGVERQKLKLYSDHLKSIKDNLHQLEQQGQTHEIIGLCWMQGEMDTRRELTATHYEVNLKNLIQACRRDLKLPALPFVCGQVNNPLRGKKDYEIGPQTVRAAIAKVAETVPHAAMIPTSTDPSWSDYPKHGDDVHYNTEGQKRLGIAFADALLQLQNPAEANP